MDLINSSIASSPFAERAFGCIIGAFIGDSCGSYVEFDELYPSKKKIDRCMKMPGGGHHGVAPGQVTDDGEMLMSLIMGYVESNKDVEKGQKKRFDFEVVGRMYSNWYRSTPFDIG